jgi:hypothetical protein
VRQRPVPTSTLVGAVPTTDVPAFPGVLVLITMVIPLACYLPARRSCADDFKAPLEAPNATTLLLSAERDHRVEVRRALCRPPGREKRDHHDDGCDDAVGDRIGR